MVAMFKKTVKCAVSNACSVLGFVNAAWLTAY